MEAEKKPKSIQRDLNYYFEQFKDSSMDDHRNEHDNMDNGMIIHPPKFQLTPQLQEIPHLESIILQNDNTQFKIFMQKHVSVPSKSILERARNYDIRGRTSMTREQLIRKLFLYESSVLSDEEWREFLGEGWIKRDAFGYRNESNSVIIGYPEDFSNLFASLNDWTNFIEISNGLDLITHPDLSQIKRISAEDSALRLNDSWYSVHLISAILGYLYPWDKFECFQHRISKNILLRTHNKCALICPIVLDEN